MFHQPHRVLALSSKLKPQNSKIRASGCFFSGFCNSVDSLELPDWFRYPKDDGSCIGSDDEFVLPTKSEFLGGRNGDCKPLSIRPSCSPSVSHGALGFEADVDEISSILKSRFTSPEAVVVAMDGCSIKVSECLVDKILRRFSNDWVPAFGFFMWASTQKGYKHSPNSYDTMVDILGKYKQFDLMWGLIGEMDEAGGLVSLATMTKVMRRLAGASRWSDAIDTFNRIERFRVVKDTRAMNVLLDALCKERSVKRARGAFLELRSEIPPDASSFNTLIHGWCKARRLQEARETMKEMQESGFHPCVITYTSLIEAYCVEKDFPMVYATLDEMRARGCPPNVITYTIVMHALGKVGKTKEALDIFDKMKAHGCTPDASFYNSLIYILGRAGRMEDANNLIEEMCKLGIAPNVTTFNTLISAACHHSQAGNALKQLVKMEDQQCTPDIKTYTPLLKLSCKRQWTKLLLFLIGHMFRKDITPDFSTYTLLVSWLCRNGKIAQSCLFLEEMMSKGLIPKQDTFNLLMETLRRENMHSTRTKIQLLMMQAAAGKPVARPSSTVLSDITRHSNGLS